MSTKKKQCTKEFKDDAVKLVTEQGYSVAEAARSLGIAASTLGRWKRKYETEKSEGGDSISQSQLRIELRRLRTENKRLQIEREILKKAAAFFAKETE